MRCLIASVFLLATTITNGADSQDGRWSRTSEGLVVDTQPSLRDYSSYKKGGAGMIRCDLNPEIAQRVSQTRFEQLARMGYSFYDPQGLLNGFAAAVNKRGTPSKTSDPRQTFEVQQPRQDEQHHMDYPGETFTVSTSPGLFSGSEPTSEPTPDPFKPDPLKSTVERLEIEQQEMRDAFRDVREQVGTMESKVDAKLLEHTRKLADINANISNALTAVEKLAALQKQSMQQTNWERSRLSKVQPTSSSGGSVSSTELASMKERIRSQGEKGYLLIGQGPKIENEWDKWSTRWNQPIMFAKPNTLKDTFDTNIEAGIWEVWFDGGQWLRRKFSNEQTANSSVWASAGTTQQVSRIQPVRRTVQAVQRFVQPRASFNAGGGGGFSGFSAGGG